MTAAVAGHITRTSLSLADLSIVDSTYDVYIDDANGLDVGTVTWRRATAESPFVAGRTLTAAVKDISTRQLRVEVGGTDLSDVQANIATLITAVSQFSYNLFLQLDTGAVYQWACEPADLAVGFNFEHVFGLIAPVNLSIPSSPIPLDGPI